VKPDQRALEQPSPRFLGTDDVRKKMLEGDVRLLQDRTKSSRERAKSVRFSFRGHVL